MGVRAEAPEAALHVGALSVKARLRTFAFVNISTVPSGVVESVTVLTLAAEHSERVFASTKHAKVVKHLALVYIYGKKASHQKP